MTSNDLAPPPHDDEVTRLRPVGWGRYVDVPFLFVWLVFWTVGEVIVLALIFGLIAGTMAAVLGTSLPYVPKVSWMPGVSAVVLLFLLLWGTLWTAGGFAALTHLLRSIAGEDRVHASAEGLHIERRAGPFRRRRLVPHAAIRRLRQRTHDRALVADTASGTIVVSELGSQAERTSLRDRLRRRLALPDEEQARRMEGETTPHGWEMEMDGVDARLFYPSRRARRIQAAIMWSITAIVALGWIGGWRTGATGIDAAICLIVTLLLGGMSAWVTWGRTEWRVRHGRLVKRRRFAGWTRDRMFDDASLELTHTIDSDGDSRFALIVQTSASRKTIVTALHDAAELASLGAWLAARTRFPFHRTPR